ncbi:MAG: segregation/condensation protein A [Chloroflexi bacterium]|nr:segregation/condensation protein A [Chloroflexota bacterium]
MFIVTLPDFDGPLDLLLISIERQERDVTTIALADIIGQYLMFLRTVGAIDIDLLAEVIAITARLIELKSRALLPRPAPPPPPEDEGDPPAELAELLQEYRRFKQAAMEFREREQEGLRSFPRLAPAPALPPSLGLGNVTLDRLLIVVQTALSRRPPDPPEEIPRHTVSVRERLAALEAELSEAGRVSFNAFIASCFTRIEIVVGFMAVLELIKGGRAAAEQPEPFGDIIIVTQTPVPASAD